MILQPRSVSICLLAILLALQMPALAQSNKGEVSPSDKTLQSGAKDAVKKMSYGMCSARPEADTYVPSPQKILLGSCYSQSQQFTMTSDNANYGRDCGGYTLAFGPLGDLKPHLHQITMTAGWGDAPLTAAQCGNARVTAAAYGERCLTDDCSSTDWHMIGGGPKQRKGKWDQASNSCQLDVKFTSQKTRHKTLTLDVIADVLVNNNYVRKRAKGTILAELKGDAGCFKAEGKAAVKEKKHEDARK